MDSHKKFQSLFDDPITAIDFKNDNKNYLFVSDPLEINADPKIVFEIVLKLDQYYNISNGAITAEILGENKKLIPDKTKIKLRLYKDRFIIPIGITATVIVADQINDNCWVIGWGSLFPTGAVNQRYHIMERLPNNKTRSYIGEKNPGVIGFLTYKLLRKTIENAFNELNAGIKKSAEKFQEERKS